MAKEGDIDIAIHRSYDVYLSFRGVDIGQTFTGQLYDALCKKKIETFKDDDDHDEGSKMGEDKAILEESRIVIVVFSKDFASSSYCLDQLVKIVENQDKRSQQVLPIFYDVDPSDVRCETDNSRYKLALAKLQQQKFPNNPDKIQKWISALSRVAPTTASYEEWQLQNWKNCKLEYERIDKIVEWVTSTLQDVFLSFSGNNTDDSIVGMLLDVLKMERFKIHMPIHMHDTKKSDKMDRISESLKEAIHKSRLSIIVLCEKYASSPLCLDELVTIFECKEMKKQQVRIIFYKMTPLDITSFGIAMAKHEQVFGEDSVEVQRWRSALNQVANLQGYSVKIGDKKELCQIVESILESINDVSICEKGDRSFTEELQQESGQDHVSVSGKDDSSFTKEHQQKSGQDHVSVSEKDDSSLTKEQKLVQDHVSVSEKYDPSLTKEHQQKPGQDHVSVSEKDDSSLTKEQKLVQDHVSVSEKYDPSLTKEHQQKSGQDHVFVSEKDDPSFKKEHQQKQGQDHVSVSEKDDLSLTKEHQQKWWRHDVFLSFNGSDTRENFTCYLYHALCSKGFKTFANEEAHEIGDKAKVMETIRESIEESRILIVILSKMYTSSHDCHKELAMILACKERNEHQQIFAIYYGVDPSDAKKFKLTNAHVEEKLISDLGQAASQNIKIGDIDQQDGCIEKIVKEASMHLPYNDVFLNLSGEDYCSFTDFLLTALQEKGFKTSINKNKGSEDRDQSSKSLVRENIEKSRLSIIILSQNYLHSPSCLNDLVTIISCMNDNRQLVWPIFLKMDPSELKNSFEQAMIEHDDHKVQEWRTAISEAAKLVSSQEFKPWHLKSGHEYEIIEEIVEKAIEI